MISLEARVGTKEGMVGTCNTVVDCSVSSLSCDPFAADDAVTVFR